MLTAFHLLWVSVKWRPTPSPNDCFLSSLNVTIYILHCDCFFQILVWKFISLVKTTKTAIYEDTRYYLVKTIHCCFCCFIVSHPLTKLQAKLALLCWRTSYKCICVYESESETHSIVSDSVRPHRQQPTRLPCPWDSPGKNTGVGCHFPSPVHESEKWKWSHSVMPNS